MSWMQKLYETYEKVQNNDCIANDDLPVPSSHTTLQAHIEITLDQSGNFIRATIVPKEETIIPATEASAGRTSGGEPHPLCDKIQYVAGDYKKYGGICESYFDDFISNGKQKDGYLSLLTKWSSFDANLKLSAVLAYVRKRKVVEDLVRSKILVLDKKGFLSSSCSDVENPPEIFKILPKKEDKYGNKIQDQGSSVVRWIVEISGEKEPRVWKDKDLIESWVRFDTENQKNKNLCYVTGAIIPISENHPSKIRNSADKAKLLSSNDLSGFTFRGRFTTSEQSCSIGYEVTQKAHSALRWMIKRQGFRNDDQVIVAWEVGGKKIPSPLDNSMDALFNEAAGGGDNISVNDIDYSSFSDIGQEYALRLRKKIAGYKVDLEDRDNIVVMGLDSSTPGRMAITYYRELLGSEFLARIEDWHSSYSWIQYGSKNIQFVGAPSPKEIAIAAYGRRIDTKTCKSTVSRLLPCIIDGASLPFDLVRSVCAHASSRLGHENWEWEKTLGIACALYRGFEKKERGVIYQMSLENNRKTRDYLYGRLLAVAERIEQVALGITGEQRETNAVKLLQRFSYRPYSTWIQIEQSLIPYKSRLQSKRPAFFAKMNGLLDDIHCMFEISDYCKDMPLSGEFLLGYHCQRRDLRSKSIDENEIEENNKEDE